MIWGEGVPSGDLIHCSTMSTPKHPSILIKQSSRREEKNLTYNNKTHNNKNPDSFGSLVNLKSTQEIDYT